MTAILRALVLACVLVGAEMALAFEQVLPRLDESEGGYVNNRRDPGGKTNRGVIQRVYDAFRDNKGKIRRSVRYITQDEVHEIYREQYWDRVRGDDLPAGLDYAVFDYAVNSGPIRAVKSLQKVLRVRADGAIGAVTMRAIRSRPVSDLINALCDRRRSFLQRLRHWKYFGRGWTARVMRVRRDALEMAATAAPAAAPTP